MTLATRTLRLHLLSVLGAPLPGAKVTLQLSSYQADEKFIVPLKWELLEDPGIPGDYVGPIWPNTRNDGGTHYDMLVQANGQQLLIEQLTVAVGPGEAVLKAKVNPPPYPAVYGAEKAVSDANTFANAAGTSATLAAQYAQGLGDVSEAVAAAQAAAEEAAAAEQQRLAYEDRVYPGVYSTPPTHRPHSGELSADGDRCAILVGSIPYEHLRVGGGWVIPNLDAANLQTENGAALVGYGPGRTVKKKLSEVDTPADSGGPEYTYLKVMRGNGTQQGGRVILFNPDAVDIESTLKNSIIVLCGRGTGVSYRVRIGPNAELAIVGGGGDHWIDQLAGSIMGGAHHWLGKNDVGAGSHGFIGGGSYNKVAGDYSGVGFGSQNEAYGSASAAISGVRNKIGAAADHLLAQYSVIPGGIDNTIPEGAYSTILSGRGNYVTSLYGAAWGRNAESTQWGMLARSVAPFDTTVRGDKQQVDFELSRVTADPVSAALNPIYLDGASRLPVIPEGGQWTGYAVVHALRLDTLQRAAFQIAFSAECTGGAVTVLSQTVTALHRSDALYLADVQGSVSGGILQIRVRSVAGATVRWAAIVTAHQMKLPTPAP